jgi:prophage regulatory protein
MIDKILRLPEVCDAVGVRRSAIYSMLRHGEFPAPLRVSRQCIGWRESTIREWLDARPIAEAHRRGGDA